MIKISKMVVVCYLLTFVMSCSVNPNKKVLIGDQPVLVNKTTNGEKLIIGNKSDPERNFIYVAKLKGTAY